MNNLLQELLRPFDLGKPVCGFEVDCRLPTLSYAWPELRFIIDIRPGRRSRARIESDRKKYLCAAGRGWRVMSIARSMLKDTGWCRSLVSHISELINKGKGNSYAQ